MIDHDYFELFQTDSIDKQLVIECENGTTITNEDIFSESMTITESLCSEENLKFGSCEASSFKIQVANIMSSLAGQWLNVGMKLDGNDEVFPLGKYKVNSDKPTADRKWREIVAYDALYDILTANVSDWYDSILPNTSTTVTMKKFRDSFFDYFGIEQEDANLVNDGITIERTTNPNGVLSGKDVVSAICEINGRFLHITRNGKARYVALASYIKGLYPSKNLYPSKKLFPRSPFGTAIAKSGNYISATYEDYKCQSITKLQIRQEENDVGAIAGDGDNCYIVENNFLVYGKSAEELETIANNLLGVITNRIYRPFNATAKGNPCFEVGDAVRLYTKYQLIESYILQRTISGIQGLRDNFVSTGSEYCEDNVNSVSKSIIQLKGKTNTLERTVDETKSTITVLDTDIKKNYSTTTEMKSAISQSASEIESSVSKTYQTIKGANETTEALKSSISQSASDIESKVSKTYQTIDDANKTTESLESKISQSASEITSSVSQTYETKKDAKTTTESLESKISQTAHTIELSVGSSSGKSTGITITLKDENGKTISTGNGTIALSGDVIVKSNLTDGSTTISGSNITTGTIDAQKVNVTHVVAESVAAENITGTCIVGKQIISDLSLKDDSNPTVGGVKFVAQSGGGYFYDCGSGDIATAISDGILQVYHPSAGGCKVEIRPDYIYSKSAEGYAWCQINNASEELDLISSSNNAWQVKAIPDASIPGTDDRFPAIYFQRGSTSQNALFYNSAGGLNQLQVLYNLAVNGSKSRAVKTKDYGTRLQYCYETPTPTFGDFGEGKLDETGKCFVYMDDVFAETIDAACKYQVFLQAYGDGACYVSERNPSYFVVQGTPNMSFGWEMKCTQRDYDSVRLEELKDDIGDMDISTDDLSDYLGELVDLNINDTYFGDDNQLAETSDYLTNFITTEVAENE